MPAVEVAQVHVVSQLPLQNLDVQFLICEILGFSILSSCHRQLFGGTPGKNFWLSQGGLADFGSGWRSKGLGSGLSGGRVTNESIIWFA